MDFTDAQGSNPRNIPDPGFAGDDGSAPAEVREALQRYGADPAGAHHATLATLQDTRVLVPVVALLGEVEYDEQGLAHDKSSDMAAVMIEGADGRTALLAFTGDDALKAWNPEARPVPVTLRKAALASIQQGGDAVLVDLAGPVMFPVQGEDLQHLAAEHTLIKLDEGWAWATISS